MVVIRAASMRQVKGGRKADRWVLSEQSDAFCLAVDIGTTTVSISLYTVQGEWISGYAKENEQGKLGSDVMMRLMHVAEGRGEALRRMIRMQIRDMARHIWREIGKKEEDISQIKTMAVVGNTVMCHLFLGEDTSGLSKAPFHPAYQGTYRCRGEKFGWEQWKDMSVIVLPGIAAHVGADAAAVIGAERLWSIDRIELAIDLGTNAEILLNHHGVVSVCSAAAGPAFEGKGTACGCRAKAGAINGVRMMRSNGNMILNVIPEDEGESFPVGICGSGLVDSIAQLRHGNIIQRDGYLLRSGEADTGRIPPEWAERLQRDEEGEPCFILYDSQIDCRWSKGRQEAGKQRRIYLSQKDIRNFQLAKAAIQAGVRVLLEKQGVSLAEIDSVKIAGVFGSFLHPEHAKSCGLLPDIPLEKIEFIGNAAERGAAAALFEPEFLPELEQRIRSMTHVELAAAPEFSGYFLEAMEFA